VIELTVDIRIGPGFDSWHLHNLKVFEFFSLFFLWFLLSSTPFVRFIYQANSTNPLELAMERLYVQERLEIHGQNNLDGRQTWNNLGFYACLTQVRR
jgi:hypothetical protein